MKRLPLVCCLSLPLVLLVPGIAATARAGEPTLLERLSAEVSAATDAADRAIVPLAGNLPGGVGVVLGSPPRLVVPWEVAGQHPTLLRQGSSGPAFERIDGDEELGVVVYALPAGETPPALPVASAWDAGRGALAVAVATDPGLVVLGRVDAARGRLEAGVPGDCRVLVDAKGRLLGLRAGASWPYYYAPTSPYVSSYSTDGGRTWWGSEEGYRNAQAAYWQALGLRNARRRVAEAVEDRDRLLRAFQAPGTTFQGLPATSFSYTIAEPPGFVPGPVIARVLADIEEHGHIRHPYLGVVPTQAAGTDGTVRVKLAAVLPDSPAAAAGLHWGDVVMQVDDLADPDLAAFERVLLLHRPGDTLRLRIERLSVEPNEEDVTVALAERTEAEKRLLTPSDLGLHVLDVTPELARWLGIDTAGPGILVDRVDEGSPAATLGIRRGDRIAAAGGKPVRDAAELEAALAAAPAGPLPLEVLRGGAEEQKELLSLPIPPKGPPATAR